MILTRIIYISLLTSCILANGIKYPSNNGITDLVENYGSAVVMIIAERDNEKERGQGSGIIVNNGNYVITNAHVIAGARKIIIKFFDGEQQTFFGYSTADQKRDLVSIKIKRNPDYKSVLIKYSNEVTIGEQVIAIGNPHGLSNSVSEGIISGKREFEKGVQILQTTAPVSPGSSGGGLFDMNGKLIGITSFLFRGGQNLNFAYPTEYITPLISHYDYHSFRALSSKFEIQSSGDEFSVYVTKTGKKFHKNGCSYLRKGSRKHKISEASYKYTPCSRCFK